MEQRFCTLFMHQYSNNATSRNCCMRQYGKQGIILALTPVVDMLERGAAQRQR